MSEESEVAGEPEQTYEQAVARLDQIINRLDSGNAELRETLDLCAEAKGLIEYCAGELTAVDQSLKELRLEDLAASLTSTPAAGDRSTPPSGPVAGDKSLPPDGDVPF